MDMHAIDSACKSMMMCICLVGELASMRVYLCTGQYGILSRLPGRPRALFIYVIIAKPAYATGSMNVIVLVIS